jgi:hypothetical protein
LREILKTMSSRLVEEVFVGIPLLGKTLSVEEIAGDPGMSGRLAHALTAFEQFILSGKDGSSLRLD